jgi:hypothetical protein
MTVFDGETFVPDPRNRFILEVRMGEREKEYVEKYGKEHRLSNDAVIRHAVRVMQLMEVTPGAWDAVNKLNLERLGPRFVKSQEAEAAIGNADLDDGC